MNTHENIIHLAQLNSRSCHPKRKEDIHKHLPYFEIYKDQLNHLNVRCSHCAQMDRMHLWETYLKNHILPNIGDPYDITGFYNIELHDSYTYLKNGHDYQNVFTFSKFKDDSGPVLIPDPDMITNWKNMLQNIQDDVHFDNKLNKIIFAGATTGHHDPSKNERIKACLWSLEYQDICEFKLTKVSQMSMDSIISTYGANQWKDIYLPRHMTIQEQLRYKYHLHIDGNTCRFDVWPMKTNSLLLKMRSHEMLWYYPMIKANSEFVEVSSLDHLSDIQEYYTANPRMARLIIKNANNLAKELFTPFSHILYTINLFETMALNRP